MSAKPGRFVLIGFAAITVVLLIVSIFAISSYSSANAALASKDRELLRVRAAMLTQNATILQLDLKILILDENITTLNQKISALLLRGVVASAQISALTYEVDVLQNKTALLTLELTVAQQAGRFTVTPLLVNRSVTVAPNTSYEVTSQPNSRNGTLIFISQRGCPSSGGKGQATATQFIYNLWLDWTSPLVTSVYQNVPAVPYSFYLQNVGSGSVSCTFSLFFVQR